VVSTETCILLPQKNHSARSTLLRKLEKLALRTWDALVINHIPCRQNHPEDIPKNKTQHYSGITFMSRERLSRVAAAFFTIPG
jgi:hypothetical protein